MKIKTCIFFESISQILVSFQSQPNIAAGLYEDKYIFEPMAQMLINPT